MNEHACHPRHRNDLRRLLLLAAAVACLWIGRAEADPPVPGRAASDPAAPGRAAADSCATNGDCTDDGNPCTDEVCNAGTCTHPNNSAPCDDGLFCNDPDTCSGGFCVPGPARVCNDSNVCTTDSCSEGLKACQFVPNSGPCDDGVFCNGSDFCAASACIGHTSFPCPGPDNDSDCAETCNELTHACDAPDPDGSSCKDADVCTLNEHCQGGVCTGDAPDCNDNDACTDDICDAEVGCLHVPNGSCVTTTLAPPTTLPASTTTSTPPTTTTLPVTTTTLPAGLCGDFNEDGKVTSGDALGILRAAVQHGPCDLARCDASGDGKVTAGDALLALRIAVKLIASTGPCPVV
jgi:Dockerin type I domain/Dictyostelium (slime mold) repeat